LWNTLGAIMILVSLLYAWNLASFVMEVIWFSISLFGMIKGWEKR
jgi:hypothetical protein